MKQATIIIDRDEMEEILREHLAGMFPTLEISIVTGLGYSDVTVRLRRPMPDIAAAPEPPFMRQALGKPEQPPAIDDDPAEVF